MASTPATDCGRTPIIYYDNGHVGMYIGNGQVLNAQNESTGIVISGLYDMAPISAMVRIV